MSFILAKARKERLQKKSREEETVLNNKDGAHHKNNGNDGDKDEVWIEKDTLVVINEKETCILAEPAPVLNNISLDPDLKDPSSKQETTVKLRYFLLNLNLT